MNCRTCGGTGLWAASSNESDPCRDCNGTGKTKPTLQGWKPGWICGKHGNTHASDCGYMDFHEPSQPSNQRSGEERLLTLEAENRELRHLWEQNEEWLVKLKVRVDKLQHTPAHEHTFVVPVEWRYTYKWEDSRGPELERVLEYREASKLRCSGCPEEVERT